MKRKLKRGNHWHRCQKCGHIWQHSNFKYSSRKDHRCPKKDCGGESWVPQFCKTSEEVECAGVVES